VRDHGKCSAAVARLAAFIADFPQSPNQTHVLQYLDIVKTLEQACGQDLSQF
jgi:outer membrane protein assembly factor BamD (BamD/ComL family)